MHVGIGRDGPHTLARRGGLLAGFAVAVAAVAVVVVVVIIVVVIVVVVTVVVVVFVVDILINRTGRVGL